MKELSKEDFFKISAGKKFKFHINVFTAVFSSVGAFLLGGPVAAGMVIGAHIAAQGAGNLHEMYVDEFGVTHET